MPKHAAPQGAQYLLGQSRTRRMRWACNVGHVVEEAVVNTENWAEERDRLVRLLAGIESGMITHVDGKTFASFKRRTRRILQG